MLANANLTAAAGTAPAPRAQHTLRKVLAISNGYEQANLLAATFESSREADQKKSGGNQEETETPEKESKIGAPASFKPTLANRVETNPP